MTTLDRVKAVIGDHAGKPADDIAADRPLGKGEFNHDTYKWSGLDLDSLDRISVAMALEEHFSIDIPDEDVDLPEMGTAQGIADYLDKRLATLGDANIAGNAPDTAAAYDEAAEAITPAETVPDYGAMSLDPLFDAVGMFEAIGADAQKWTEAFMQIACMATPLGKALRGFPHADRTELHEIMVSWFANAIAVGESAGAYRGERAGLGLAEPDPDSSDIGWESRNHPDRHVDYDGDLDEAGRWPGDEGYTEPFRNPSPSGVDRVTFRKRPVEIEAVRFLHVADGVPCFNVETPPGWLVEALGGPAGHSGSAWTAFAKPDAETATVLAIGTREGNLIASPCDWIIRGVKGELYPIKPAIFRATYEAVASD